MAAVVIGVRRAESGIFENQGAAIIEEDFLGTPCRALVELVGLRLGWGPRLVEPVQIRLVIGDPFLDRLPGRLDGLRGLGATIKTVDSEPNRPTAKKDSIPKGCRNLLLGWGAWGCRWAGPESGEKKFYRFQVVFFGFFVLMAVTGYAL